MTQGENLAAPAVEDFSDVFERDSHDRGADAVAPNASQPRDDAGRFAPKSEAALEQPQQQPAPEQQALQPPIDADANRHVPLRELKSERSKRQEAEKAAIEYKAKVEAYEQLLQRQQPPPQQQQGPELPDPYTDPVGYGQAIVKQAQYQSRIQLANMSEAHARRQYGHQLVDEAVQWAANSGRVEHFLFRAAEPYSELIETYKKAKEFEAIGPDPSAYRKRIEEETRAKVLAELKGGRTQPPQQFPASLASATGSGSQGAHLSMEAVANELFDTNRNRRQW